MRFPVAVHFVVLTISASWPRGADADPVTAPRGSSVSVSSPNANGGEANSEKASPEKISLSDEGELAKVVGLYEAGKYRECASALGPLLDPKYQGRLRERSVIEHARIYLAACLIGSDRPEEADEPLRAAIRENMQMKAPDSLLFPPPVVELFLQVRQSLYEEIRQAEAERLRKARESVEDRLRRQQREVRRVLELERLANSEMIVTKNRRWVAFVPFGVGQFQNGNHGLGWVFLTSEAVLGATALTAIGVYTHFQAESSRLKNPDNNAVVESWYTLFQVSSYSFLAVAALGIAEAHLSFVPEFRELRPRPLPPKLRRGIALRPSVGATPDGVMAGLSGAF